MAWLAGGEVLAASGYMSADLLKMADVLRLAPASPRCEMTWVQFAREDPRGAQLVRSYVAQCRTEGASMNKSIDKMVLKARAKASCLGCGRKLKPSRMICKCGRVSPVYRGKTSDTPVTSAKASRGLTKSGRQLVTKASRAQRAEDDRVAELMREAITGQRAG